MSENVNIINQGFRYLLKALAPISWHVNSRSNIKANGGGKEFLTY
jgi:hypothetical protein